VADERAEGRLRPLTYKVNILSRQLSLCNRSAIRHTNEAGSAVNVALLSRPPSPCRPPASSQRKHSSRRRRRALRDEPVDPPPLRLCPVKITLQADCAVRVLVEMPSRPSTDIITATALAERLTTSRRHLFYVLAKLQKANLISSRQGPSGGFAMNRPSNAISIADVIRAVDGPLLSVGGVEAGDIRYGGSRQALSQVWQAALVSMQGVFETVTVADFVTDGGAHE
jgi:Rrf2 family protein